MSNTNDNENDERRCECCGEHHDPESVLNGIGTLLAELAAMVGEQGAPLAFAVFLAAPRDGQPGVASRFVLHPDAFPDVADLTTAMRALADNVDARQGQVNFETHEMRQERGRG